MNNANYKKICSDYLKNLSPRTANVIERRFGLKTGKRETLEAIGQSHGITRERVRQIEKEGFNKISPKIKENKAVFDHFNKTIASFGNIKKEDALLNILGENKYQNQVFFLLSNGPGFNRILETENLHTFWTIDKNSIDSAKKTINSIINRLKKKKETLSLKELAQETNLNEKVLFSYIETSKQIQKNPEGKYGLRNWLEINPKGVKDKAYLVLKKQEKPLHFRDIASSIDNLPFPKEKKIHTATVHNELIKDQRFVLVGRGLYGLREWGFEPGVIKDIIAKLLKESKRPLTKDEIIEKVLKQRFVKENTIALNLQNRNYFARDEKGRYNVKEA